MDVPMGSEATRGEAGSPDDLAESVPELAAPEALAVGSEGTPAAVAQAPGDLLEPGGGPGNLSESVPAPAAPRSLGDPGEDACRRARRVNAGRQGAARRPSS